MNRSKFLILMENDLKQIFRDRVMYIFLGLPFLIIPILKWGVPFLSDIFPILENYHPLIVCMMVSVPAVIPAYIISFIMLEEKDRQIFSALRILPISSWGFLSYRMLLIFICGWFYAWITLVTADLMTMGWGQSLSLSFLAALSAPITTLLVLNFAKNKIEGVTMLKGINFIYMFPMMIIIIGPEWEKAIGMIPFYWTFLAFNSNDDPNLLGWAVTIGLGVHIVAIGLLAHQFRRRVFAR